MIKTNSNFIWNPEMTEAAFKDAIMDDYCPICGKLMKDIQADPPLRLTDGPEFRKLAFIKHLRTDIHIGLKEAKDIADQFCEMVYREMVLNDLVLIARRNEGRVELERLEMEINQLTLKADTLRRSLYD